MAGINLILIKSLDKSKAYWIIEIIKVIGAIVVVIGGFTAYFTDINPQNWIKRYLKVKQPKPKLSDDGLKCKTQN